MTVKRRRPSGVGPRNAAARPVARGPRRLVSQISCYPADSASTRRRRPPPAGQPSLIFVFSRTRTAFQACGSLLLRSGGAAACRRAAAGIRSGAGGSLPVFNNPGARSWSIRGSHKDEIAESPDEVERRTSASAAARQRLDDDAGGGGLEGVRRAPGVRFQSCRVRGPPSKARSRNMPVSWRVRTRAAGQERSGCGRAR